MSDKVQPQDQDIAVVARNWQRKNRRAGVLTESGRSKART